MFEEKEIEELLDRAIRRRVQEVLGDAGVPGEPARQPRVWLWTKAWGILLAPGILFGVFLSSILHNWVAVVIPTLLIYLSLLWR